MMRNKISIDISTCVGCMSCVKACPLAVLEIPEAGRSTDTSPSRPQVHPERFCIRCMHCMAACPSGAIRYDADPQILISTPPPQQEEFPKQLKLQMMRRRSYRNFSKMTIPRKTIEDVLNLTAWAPSAENQHPVKWIVIESHEFIEKMMNCITDHLLETKQNPEIIDNLSHGKNLVMGTPGTLLLAHTSPKAARPETDTAIAMTTAELYLQSQDIGTLWCGYLERFCNTVPSLRRLLIQAGLPEDDHVYGAMVIGYPDRERYLHIPKRLRHPEIRWI